MVHVLQVVLIIYKTYCETGWEPPTNLTSLSLRSRQPHTSKWHRSCLSLSGLRSSGGGGGEWINCFVYWCVNDDSSMLILNRQMLIFTDFGVVWGGIQMAVYFLNWIGWEVGKCDRCETHSLSVPWWETSLGEKTLSSRFLIEILGLYCTSSVNWWRLDLNVMWENSALPRIQQITVICLYFEWCWYYCCYWCNHHWLDNVVLLFSLPFPLLWAQWTSLGPLDPLL